MQSRALSFVLSAALSGALGCAVLPPQGTTPAAQSAVLVLCNDSATSLRIRPNWEAVLPIPPKQCMKVAVPVGPALLTVFPVSRPYGWLKHPAGWLEVPPGGAIARYGEDDGFLLLRSVTGTTQWARCDYPGGFGPKPPARPHLQIWRDDLLRWMRTNLVCEPRAQATK